MREKSFIALFVSFLLASAGASVAQNAIDVAADGDVGIGTSSPISSLHVRRTDGSARLLVEEASETAAWRTLFEIKNKGRAGFRFANTLLSQQWQFFHSEANNFIILHDSGGTELRLAPNGDLTIEGKLFTTGPTCGSGCDRLFAPETAVESIEDHAAYMWSNRHLPGVGPTPEGEPIDITETTGGLLNELEKAHIYIEQLSTALLDVNESLAAKDQELLRLSERLSQLEQSLSRKQ